MTTSGSTRPVLEAAAQQFVEATAKPPCVFELPVEEGRKAVDAAQDGQFPEPAATRQDLTIDGAPAGQVNIAIYRPAGATGVLPVVLYTHGAGWVFGDLHTRPAGPAADHPRRCRDRVHLLQPVAGSEIPDRHRADLRRAGVGCRPWRRTRPGRDPDRGRR
jgi:hypothetical protein